MSTFISYSTKDLEIVKKIVFALEAEGIRCFYAPRDIAPGAEYATEIVKAIKNVDCMTLIFSNASNASMYVLREINSAVLNNKMVIPFKVDDTAPSESMEFYLGATHWLIAYPTISETEIEKLVKAITKKSVTIEGEKQGYFKKPTILNAAEAELYGYDVHRIAMETIQLDYLALSGNEYIIKD